MTAAPRGVRGLSLLEVLITIAILSLLVAVLAQGWFQSLQSQVRLAAVADSHVAHQKIAIAVRQLIAEALLAGSGSGEALRGDARVIEAESSTSLRPDLGAAPMAVRLSLVEGPGGVEMRVGHPGAAPAQSLLWRFAQAQWRYHDQQGVEHDRWPAGAAEAGDLPPLDRDDLLPSRVVLHYRLVGEPQTHEIVASPRASPWAVPEATPALPGVGLH